MTRRASTGLWMMISLSMACADAHHGRESRDRSGAPPDAGDVMLSAADADADANTSASRDAGSAGRDGAGQRPRKLNAENTLRESEVWIGELWTNTIALCEVGERELRRVNPEGQVTRVVLVLEPDARGKAVGRIQFGDLEGVPLPDAPDVVSFETQDSFWACSSRHPTKGVEYTLSNLVKNDQRVEFEFSPNQLWNRWCATAKPVCSSQESCLDGPWCVCKGDACAADLRVIVPVKLALKGDSLEGGFAPGIFDTMSDLRLKRAR